eukprot:scaffold20544_cov158-Amphora_coffeaeformis.AAC.4
MGANDRIQTTNVCHPPGLSLSLSNKGGGEVELPVAVNKSSKRATQKSVAVQTDETKKKKKTTKTSNSNKGPQHWTTSSDYFSLVFNSTNGLKVFHSFSELSTAKRLDAADCVASSVSLTIRGNPLPLRRHRTSRGFVYNPSALAQASFRNETSMLVFGVPSDNQPSTQSPLFSSEQALAVTIILCLRRPLSHFRSSKRENCILKANAPNALTSTTRTDADNLAKFVLDACNGLLYEDDRQIQSLHVIKKLDNQDQCIGSTQLLIRAINDSMEEEILQHAMRPYHHLPNDSDEQ